MLPPGPKVFERLLRDYVGINANTNAKNLLEDEVTKLNERSSAL